MAQFTIYFTQTASCAIEVEAEDLDEAIDLAYEQVPSGLCAHCAGFGSEAGIDLAGDWEPLDEHTKDGEAVHHA